MMMVESILKQLSVSDDYLESAKVAAILHDVGALEGKKIMLKEENCFQKNTSEIKNYIYHSKMKFYLQLKIIVMGLNLMN